MTPSERESNIISLKSREITPILALTIEDIYELIEATKFVLNVQQKTSRILKMQERTQGQGVKELRDIEEQLKNISGWAYSAVAALSSHVIDGLGKG